MTTPSELRDQLRQAMNAGWHLRWAALITVEIRRCLLAQRQQVPTGSATMKAIDYSLKRWAQLTRFVAGGAPVTTGVNCMVWVGKPYIR
jgi:Transposase IS66 family